LLKEGTQFEGDEDHCYALIFENKHRTQNVITLGQVFFDIHYVVFDATPAMEKN
jgi:hypothetical protein